MLQVWEVWEVQVVRQALLRDAWAAQDHAQNVLHAGKWQAVVGLTGREEEDVLHEGYRQAVVENKAAAGRQHAGNLGAWGIVGRTHPHIPPHFPSPLCNISLTCEMASQPPSRRVAVWGAGLRDGKRCTAWLAWKGGQGGSSPGAGWAGRPGGRRP